MKVYGKRLVWLNVWYVVKVVSMDPGTPSASQKCKMYELDFALDTHVQECWGQDAPSLIRATNRPLDTCQSSVSMQGKEPCTKVRVVTWIKYGIMKLREVLKKLNSRGIYVKGMQKVDFKEKN